MTSDRFWPGYSLETERLSLRAFRDDDLEALYVIHSDPEVARYLYCSARGRVAERSGAGRRVHCVRCPEGRAETIPPGIQVRRSRRRTPAQ